MKRTKRIFVVALVVSTFAVLAIIAAPVAAWDPWLERNPQIFDTEYCPDQWWNYDFTSQLEYYSIWAAHQDFFDEMYMSGYSESSEYALGLRAEDLGYDVEWDAVNLDNYEEYRTEGTHVWENGGYATKVRIP